MFQRGIYPLADELRRYISIGKKLIAWIDRNDARDIVDILVVAKFINIRMRHTHDGAKLPGGAGKCNKVPLFEIFFHVAQAFEPNALHGGRIIANGYLKAFLAPAASHFNFLNTAGDGNAFIHAT